MPLLPLDVLQRVTRDMHGIKVVTLQTGRLGSFDVTTLLLELTTSLTLLAISTTIVDMLATRSVAAWWWW